MIFHPGDEDVGTKTLRQLQAEEDEEEKFQADLKKAVRQSLGSFSTVPAYLLYLFINLWDFLLVSILVYCLTQPSLHLRTRSFILDVKLPFFHFHHICSVIILE